MKLLRLAWRNVWRNRRRTFITMGAIVFAVVLIAAANSVQYGTYDAMEGYVVRLFTSDVQVHRQGFQDEQTFSYALEEAEQDWDALAAQPGIEAAAPRVDGFGLVSSDSASTGAAIIGIDPARESDVSTFLGTVAGGRSLVPGDDHTVLLGQTLARNLSVAVGDTVVVLTQGYRNEMGADLYVVAGLLKTGSPDVDRGMMVMTLQDAQMLFAMEGRFTTLALRTRDFQAADAYAARLREQLPDDRYEVLSWRALMPEMEQARALDDAGNNIFYLFLLVLLGFEIFNTTLMSVMERVREFGVMQSIGMKPGQVSLLVLLELSLKVVLGLGASLVVLGVLAFFFGGYTIPLSEALREAYESFGYTVEGITFSTRPIVFLQPLLSVLIVSLLATLYPVFRVRRFSPVEAFRHV